MFISKSVLEDLRRAIIGLLNLLDDALGIPRTLPSKEERRKSRQLDR